MPIPKYQCYPSCSDTPCAQCHPAEHVAHTLLEAERMIAKSRTLVLEMRRLLLQHAPIADAEVIAALALSYELVGD